MGTYTADFETTTDPTDCRVWAWGISSLDDPDNVTHGTDIETFIEHVSSLGHSRIFFHNLKFDGSFIVDYLFRAGFTHSPRERVRTERGGTVLYDQPLHTFSTLMSNMGKLYELVVALPGATVTFRDSLKLLNMSVSAIADTFFLPQSKGEIDYHAYRALGHELTPDELDYLQRDVSIVSTAMSQVIEDGLTRMTAGSNALAEYQGLIGERAWERLFPVLTPREDDLVRSAYRGGFTYADPRYAQRLLETPGVVLDINSLYPSVMKATQLPVGPPLPFEGEPFWERWEGCLFIFTVRFTATLKPDHIPIIQVKKSSRFVETEYQRVIDDPVTLTVTNIDWALYLEHYEIDVISYHGGYAFDSRRDLFDGYVDKWMEVKERSKREGNAGMTAISKIMLVSLYGKFATSTNVTGKYPLMRNNHVVWEIGADESREPVYTPVGAFITAHARATTIRAAQANYDTFAYADTDSLHLLQPDPPTDLDIHPTRLGAWDLEGRFTRALYIRAKAYAEEMEGGMSVHIAGLPTRLAKELTFDDLYDGNVISGKLVPRSVPGGVVLMDTPYEIKF